MSNTSNLRAKLSSRWYWVVLTMALFTVVLFPLVNKVEYQASSTIAINVDKKEIVDGNEQKVAVSNDSYVETLDNFGLQLINKLRSVPVQIQIAENMGRSTDNVEYTKPFFEIRNHGLGEINLTYIGNDEDEAHKFSTSVNSIHAKIVEELKTNNKTFDISQRKTEFNSTNKIKSSLESRALPTIAGLLFGLVLIILVPKKD